MAIRFPKVAVAAPFLEEEEEGGQSMYELARCSWLIYVYVVLFCCYLLVLRLNSRDSKSNIGYKVDIS